MASSPPIGSRHFSASSRLAGGKVSSIGRGNPLDCRRKIPSCWRFFRWIRTIVHAGFFHCTSHNLSHSYLSKAFGYLSACTNILIAPFTPSRFTTMADQDQTKTDDDQQTADVSNTTTTPKPNNKTATDVPDGNRSATSNDISQACWKKSSPSSSYSWETNVGFRFLRQRKLWRTCWSKSVWLNKVGRQTTTEVLRNLRKKQRRDKNGNSGIRNRYPISERRLPRRKMDRSKRTNLSQN